MVYTRPSSVLKSLQEAGYKVHVDHRRFVEVGVPGLDVSLRAGPFTRGMLHEYGIPGELIDPRGGQTTISVVSPDEMQGWVGTAVCSDTDNFCRATGLGIALERIFSGAGIRVSEASADGLTFVPKGQ